jgi:pimeloyl-ACP methyl ester carboxylesterase
MSQSNKLRRKLTHTGNAHHIRAAASVHARRTRGLSRCMLPFVTLLLPVPVFADDIQPPPTGLQHHVVFTEYSPFSRSIELARRLTSPLIAAQMQKEMARSRLSLREQSIDLTREEFVVYVPSKVPPRKYGLLVFVPPWENAMVPQGWISTLDRNGVIFVSAAKSGNDANVLDRREPLALLAAQYILGRYPVDPERVYIGGFSGGSRVAMRIALGFPDVFHGALLDAGSDPIGDRQAPVPPAELFRRFQDSTRLVYLSGNNDLVNQGKDASSAQSMREWCVFNLVTEEIPRAGHEVANAAALHRAFDELAKYVPPDPHKLADCRARLDRELTEKLQQVENFVADGKLRDARTLLNNVDARYGGLAAPRSVELAEEIDARH